MTARKPCWETCGEDEARSGEPTCPDYRPGKPEWWPNNPWVAGNHVARTETWEQGVDAMAKALLEKIECHLVRVFECGGAWHYAIAGQDWERIRREVLSE